MEKIKEMLTGTAGSIVGAIVLLIVGMIVIKLLMKVSVPVAVTALSIYLILRLMGGKPLPAILAAVIIAARTLLSAVVGRRRSLRIPAERLLTLRLIIRIMTVVSVQ